EGLRFERCYATVALCCPSRAALISGQWPYHNGILNQVHVPERTRWDMEPDVITYSQRLREAGYRLGYVGKWHASWRRTPLDFGFHDLRAPTGCSPENMRALREAGRLDDDDDVGAHRRRLGIANYAANVEQEGAITWPGEHEAHVLYGVDHNPEEATRAHFETGHGIRLIERYAAGDQPWFVTINVVEPHDPYLPLAEYARHYDPREVELPESWYDTVHEGKPNLLKREAQIWEQLTEAQYRAALARYYAFCEQVDAQVGRVMEALERTGQAERTLVVFTTDHGDMVGAHRLFIKGWEPYEETYRLPLVARWPAGIAPGGVCEHVVQLHDLAHTVVEVAGAEPIQPPGDADGRSLAPLFRQPALQAVEGSCWSGTGPALGDGRDGTWEDTAFCMYYGGEFLYTQRMVVTRRYKYVFNAFDFDELYDLQEDPSELRNLADDPAHQGTADALRERLYALMARHDDPYGTNRYGAPRYLRRPSSR
ncbi:MAG: sulfatase-like hydrolase/transferase, partial [Chloroflexota bacterium]